MKDHHGDMSGPTHPNEQCESFVITPEEAALAVHNLLCKKDCDGDLIAAVFEFTFGLVKEAGYDDFSDEIMVTLEPDFTEDEARADWNIF